MDLRIAAGAVLADGTRTLDLEVLLAMRANGKRTVTEVANELGASRFRVARAVARLEADGFAVRQHDPDGRRSPVALTSKGRARLSRLR